MTVLDLDMITSSDSAEVEGETEAVRQCLTRVGLLLIFGVEHLVIRRLCLAALASISFIWLH